MNSTPFCCREEYTYKRLRDARDASQSTTIDALVCSCGSNKCPGLLYPSRCAQRWYPTQSHTVQNACVHEKQTDSVTSGVPVPKRTPVSKKRPQPSVTQSRQSRIPQNVLVSVIYCTELYKEIDWITGFLQANSGQSGLTLQLKHLFQL